MAKPDSTTLKMAFAYRNSISNGIIDPAKVDTIAKAHLVRLMYSRLVEYTSAGQLTGSLAESFRVEGNKAIFKIRSGLKTASGASIDVEDVAMSFRRLLVKNSNTHGRLELFVCARAATIQDVLVNCPGIEVRGQEVLFEMHPGVSPSFFIPMLASTDFSIIPRGAVDLKDPGLAITNYDETSGLYRLVKDDASDFRHEFAINPHHPEYSANHAARIVLEPIYGAKAKEAMIAGTVDFIPTTSYLSAEDAAQLQSKMGAQLQLHATHPIQLSAVMFTKRGLKELSVNQRVSLGAKLKSGYLTAFAELQLAPTDQIFPSLGEGSLEKVQLEQISAMYEAAAGQDLAAGKFILGIAPGDLPSFQKILGPLAGPTGPAELRELVQAPWTIEYVNQPHAYVSTQDAAFFEDISLVAYGMQHGFLSGENGDQWIQKYISTEDKSSRMQLLRSLHYRSLEQGLIVPIGVAPYRAAAVAPWRMKFPRFFAGSPLWMLQKN